MAKIGRFKSDAARAEFLRAYDALAAQWPVPSDDIDVETSFGTTRVRKSGAGQGIPLLLLPGIGGNCLFWSPFIEELARDRVVYTPDIIGWAGRCEQTAPLRDETDIVRWIAETLDGLGVDRVHLVGYSQGGWLAAVAGIHRPDRLASLSLLEPAPATFARPSWKLLWKFATAGMPPTREKLAKLNAWLQPSIEPSELEWAMIEAALKFRFGLPWPRPIPGARFATITAPLLVLFGAETVVHDAEVAAGRVRNMVPSADIEIYPSVGHDMLWAIPERVIPRVLEFAADHDRANV
ncbi:alpha/beta fold hydrolase [Nocardia arthritidis]|uniref:Alpha/beta fold hydrolase n=1 Tax=Nocardia arthritidis TaxID=228602 RepID=A0A6G9YHP1_9NOCA|nr:alpha/beta fold hydrolase [Nocardia arthritidis]QIS12718.1 alpha/beta fold hydrolase [Nocardia arthritidis]